MSYEFEVATHLKPQRRDIADALPDAAKLSGTFDGEGQLEVQCRSWGYMIDGPFRCEPEDLGEALAHAVVAPLWLIQIHVPLFDPKVARESAAKVATHVARKRHGAVYDPQRDRVIFPRGGKRPTPSRRADELTRTLKCEWCYPAKVLAAKGEAFLSVAERFLPEVTPVRFGTFEPLQHRFNDGRSAFVDMWREESGSSGSLIWTCKKPGLGGAASWPFDNQANAKLGGVATARLYVEMEGDILTTDTRWRSAVTTFFNVVSSRTEAIYGRAILAPPAPREIAASDIEHVLVPAAAFRGRWHGLPRHPAWLTWLGGGYADALTRGVEPPPQHTSTACGLLFVQDENLDAVSELPLDGIPEALYRVQNQDHGGGFRERLVGELSFRDADWLP